MTGTRRLLWFGPAAAALLCTGIFVIGLLIPDYSHVRQTVSELGEVGSPGRVPFTALLLLVAVCLATFAAGVARTLREMGNSSLPAYFIGAMAISVAGVGVFPFPEPLHNVFGMSELIGYQAPLVAALASRKGHGARAIRGSSALMYAAVLVAIAANLTVLDRSGDIWARLQPYYGVVQRALFAAWFLWCAVYAVLLRRVPERASTN
ncbi:MAG: DUF998 domain-containing protein [Pyrinomonadaceae bacterium]